MKLIFLHGLGQTGESWRAVAQEFPKYDRVCPDLFVNGRLPKNLSSLTRTINSLIEESTDDVIVIGLSLGAMLALTLLDNPQPNLKGIVACAGQYQFRHNKAYKLQVSLFKLFPKFFFKKQGMEKDNVMAFYKEMADFDITEILKTSRVPCQLICGDKDKVNLKTSEELQALIPNSQLMILTNTGHESNKGNPKDLVVTIKNFIERIENDK